MDKKFILKVFTADGQLYFSAVGTLGTIRNFIEDFSGLGYVLKVFELIEESEVK